MAIEWIFIQIFVNTIEVSALFYLLCSKFTAKYGTFIPTLLFIIGNIIILSLRIVVRFLETSIMIELLSFSGVLLYVLFFRNGSILKKIFWVVISIALVLAMAMFSVNIIAIIRGGSYINIITMTSIERLLVMILAKTLQIIVFYILAKKRRELKTKLSPFPILICFVIPLISLIVMTFVYFLILNGLYIPENVLFPVAISYIAINIIVFILYEIINREAEKNYALIAKAKQYELTEQHNNQVIEVYDRMREWRHDYNNHMQLIVGMLESPDSNNDEIINYIKDLDEKIKSSSLEIVTGNLLIDAIVSVKATLASVHDISFEYKISLTDAITIDDTDLCSILSNLLDNAIEACCKLVENRYIHLEMLIFRNQFNIKIKNSTDGNYRIENGRFKTTKSGDLHGIGMGHVKSIVENYGGIFDAVPESDSFTVNISIPLKRKILK
jgi:signal transduction histidine kinase